MHKDARASSATPDTKVSRNFTFRVEQNTPITKKKRARRPDPDDVNEEEQGRVQVTVNLLYMYMCTCIIIAIEWLHKWFSFYIDQHCFLPSFAMIVLCEGASGTYINLSCFLQLIFLASR